MSTVCNSSSRRVYAFTWPYPTPGKWGVHGQIFRHILTHMKWKYIFQNNIYIDSLGILHHITLPHSVPSTCVSTLQPCNLPPNNSNNNNEKVQFVSVYSLEHGKIWTFKKYSLQIWGKNQSFKSSFKKQKQANQKDSVRNQVEDQNMEAALMNVFYHLNN